MHDFASLMRRAEALRRGAPDPEWWTGYVRGLRRAHHGEEFGTQAEHELLLLMLESPDPQRAELGRGYRAGLTGSARGE